MRSSSAPVVLVVGIHVRLVQARRDVRPGAQHISVVLPRQVDLEAFVLDGESARQARAVVELGRCQPGFPRSHPARHRSLLHQLALLHEVARLLCLGGLAQAEVDNLDPLRILHAVLVHIAMCVTPRRVICMVP